MDPQKILGSDFFDMPRAERIRRLDANADEVLAQQKIVRPITADERDSLKEEYVQASIELANEQEQYDEVKKEWKETLDPIKKRKKDRLQTIQTGYEETVGDKYMIRDHETGRVYTFLESGQLIDDRRMMEHERQSTIHSNMKSLNE